jgi:hypothetical protein
MREMFNPNKLELYLQNFCRKNTPIYLKFYKKA